MKATVVKLEDEKSYNFRNDCLGKTFDVINIVNDEHLGDLYNLDTKELLGCITAWTQDFLQLE